MRMRSRCPMHSFFLSVHVAIQNATAWVTQRERIKGAATLGGNQVKIIKATENLSKNADFLPIALALSSNRGKYPEVRFQLS